MIKILNLKLVIELSEYQNRKTFLLKDIAFMLKKVKNTVPWTYVFNDLKGEEITGTFYAKELQKTNQ